MAEIDSPETRPSSPERDARGIENNEMSNGTEATARAIGTPETGGSGRTQTSGGLKKTPRGPSDATPPSAPDDRPALTKSRGDNALVAGIGKPSSVGKSTPTSTIATTTTTPSSPGKYSPAKISLRRPLPTIAQRNAMGEYVPRKGQAPLSGLAVPTPGPLSYSPKLPSSGQQYSILGKHGDMKSEIPVGPGPAKYNIRPEDAASGGCSFGVRMEGQAAASDSPGPLYNVNWLGVGTESTSAVIAGRHPVKASEVPSPNKYFPASQLGHAPAHSMGHRFVNLQDAHPGPTDYDVHYPAPCPPSYSVGGRRGEVFDVQGAASMPAPNEYNPQLPRCTVTVTLKEETAKAPKSLETPGPANYIIHSNLNSGPQYSLIGRNIAYEDEPYYMPQPGPGSYEPNDDLIKTRIPKIAMRPVSRRIQRVSKNAPGPGSYEVKQHTVKANGAQKATMKGKWRSFTDTTPGPGYYNLAPTIGEVARPPRGLFPDPTRRKSNPSSSSDGSTTATPRGPSSGAAASSSPGPADYALVSKLYSIGRTGPSITLGTRWGEEKKALVPGPNAYSPSPASPKKERDGPTMKGRPSPFVMVFPTTRLSTLRA